LDLHAIKTPPSDDERAAIDSVLGDSTAAPGDTTPSRKAQSQRHLMLPALHAAQTRVGWISEGALGYICERLHIPPAEGYGVASFYSLFSMRERPKHVVHVCDDIACKTRGADALIASLEREVGPAGTDLNGATWHRSPCLGLCERAPAAMSIQAGVTPRDRAWGHATADQIGAILSGAEPPPALEDEIPQRGSPELKLLARVGVVDPTSLDDYRAHHGYHALRRALELGPAGTVREVTESKLLGRGGAAFPAGRKWEAVAKMLARPHYIVCNADESEPGTFKDRVLLESDPFAVIEAMTIAGFATGSEHGFLYIRGEYPLATARLENAIAAARRRGFLGKNILGKGLDFDIELRRGAGAYICGEETALFNSIEGYRGEPRNKPPFPVESGLFEKPTSINNVETLISVLDVILRGSVEYAATGTSGSTGTKLFCLSGNIQRPGVYEVPLGTRLDELIALGGGPPPGRKVQAVLLGGAAGSFVTPDELHVRLTFENTRAIGATLGSGVVLVFDDSIELPPILQRIAAFFRDESCGQCVPCRVGTVRQEELISRLVRKKPHGSAEAERALLGELGQAMRDASICGLGQTASSAIESAIKKLALYEETR
jgi:NADH-quinone oxidoreductase subunit F